MRQEPCILKANMAGWYIILKRLDRHEGMSPFIISEDIRSTLTSYLTMEGTTNGVEKF